MRFLVSITQCVCVFANTPQGMASPVCMLMSNRFMETIDRALKDRRPFCYSDVVGFVLLMDNSPEDFHTFICRPCHLPGRPGTAANNL